MSEENPKELGTLEENDKAFADKLEQSLFQFAAMELQFSHSGDGVEGEGREYAVGGDLCATCVHCYGEKDWCPLLD